MTKFLDENGLQTYHTALQAKMIEDFATKSYVDNLITESNEIKIEIVESLPENPFANIIYLILNSNNESNNLYDEYLWINNAWELIGSSSIDLTQYYTKTEIDNKNYLTNIPAEYITGTELNSSLNSYATITYVDGKVSSVYKYKGSVTNQSALDSLADKTIGDVYNLEDTGMNVAWNGANWDELGATIDLSDYALKADIPTKISSFTNDSGYLTSHQDISGKEDNANKTTSITSSSTDTQYPSAKAVYDLFNSITNGDEVSY